MSIKEELKYCAIYQLELMIERNRYVEEAKEEYKIRTGKEYCK